MAIEQRRGTGRRVGELARASGLTVRTLHYYEQIGLLVPSRRSDAGQRIYDEVDMARLYRIRLLRRVGLPLAEIGRALDDATWSLSAAMERHLGELDRRLEATARHRSRLAGLVMAIGSGHTVPIDELLTTVEEMTMLDTATPASHCWSTATSRPPTSGWSGSSASARGGSTATTMARLCTRSCRLATA